MKTKRELNVALLYPRMPRNNARIIQEYYNKQIAPLQSDATYAKHMYSLTKFCEVINDHNVLLFDEWDYDVADIYLSMIDCNYDIFTTIIKIVKEIVYSSGCKQSLEEIRAVNYTNIYRIPFCTFVEMDTMIRRAYSASHEHIDWSTVNDWSTMIVICYLMWLGFTRQEIASLRKEDYDLRSNVIVFEDKNRIKRILVDEPDIEVYLKRYVGASGYYGYNEYHKEKFVHYLVGDTLLKTIIRSNNFTFQHVEQYARKFRTYFGFKADDVLNAGRMNRLYYLDIMKGMDITVQNAKAIAEDLGIEIPNSVTRNGELGALIATYPSYKQKRMATRR